MNHEGSKMRAERCALFAILAFAPLGLGAKGCDHAVVGDDGQCTQNCAGEAGAGTGGTDAGGTGGKGGTPGTGGVAGKGGSGGTGAGSAGAGRGGAGAGSGGTGSGTLTCGGLQGIACPDRQYCDFPATAACGAADQTGVCVALPDACDAVYKPVCGCDDRTYGNACEAALQGVSVAAEGACSATGQACGARAGDTCADDEYCAFTREAMCGSADGEGTCQPRPEVCDDIYAPVCGCDGRTYSSECTANGSGMGVFTDGACAQGDESCGGITGKLCADGSFCQFDPKTSCGSGDQTGVCAAIPAACTKEYAPVCGCDGNTYGNECTANMAGVSVASEGECETTRDACGGITGIQCPEGQYCTFPIESGCGASDAPGKCSVKPEGCTADYTPVCGCDGRTYSNACTAASNGILVLAEGPCAK